MIRLTAYVSGRVQRTGYRAKVVALAKELNLAGIVQNRPDGQVLVIAEGRNREDLEKLVTEINIKNALIDVKSISAEYSHGSGEYSVFKKITGPEEVGERLDDGIEILKEMVVGLNKLLDKQDQMLEKQDQMLEKQDQILDKQDETVEEIRGLREDTLIRSDKRLAGIEKDIRIIKSKIGIR